MPSRWDAATHGWSRRVFHYPLPTLMSRNFRLPCTIELQLTQQVGSRLDPGPPGAEEGNRRKVILRDRISDGIVALDAPAQLALVDGSDRKGRRWPAASVDNLPLPWLVMVAGFGCDIELVDCRGPSGQCDVFGVVVDVPRAAGGRMVVSPPCPDPAAGSSARWGC